MFTWSRVRTLIVRALLDPWRDASPTAAGLGADDRIGGSAGLRALRRSQEAVERFSNSGRDVA
jgi:hypothetical protein